MATILSPSARFSSSTATQRPPQNLPPLKSQHPISSQKPLLATLTATIAATTILTATAPPPSLADPAQAYRLYYGTAASAANYGGYGGNSDKKASAEYVYDVPEGWKERLVSKVEKGTNGTDSEFYNPKKRTEKEYLTFLAGFRQLAPKDVVLNNLALSDVDLQDLISGADSVKSEEKNDDNGQLYYVYEIDGVGKHSLIKVTCAKNKLYAHFVNAPTPEWNKDEETLRHLHESFKTVGSF
ncbi:thylakoid lumenal 19 kDa protein, chloroplastic [Ricinus communis]|uniref:Thylakoid lumenal 19 kDa protein, chloroplast, putative n=1 Tax=Ricinus communis TaxID=3988 RepID=B9SL97_RICCO|nr:thylakoid lumenal 19 kDa protein, chloroplastic [Ricinus communis]EEF35620.1 Thylakoid lumenal 19 kDa protein, chloroplast precursor, putative [Ricinus communis]|eukprot:XP_002526766.1 thylakoid lumenal 19 kDa protein, chloroplastic [Ricinus communis]